MIIRELIQRVQSLYSMGVQSDDSRLSARHIYNKLKTLRLKYIVYQANKKEKISQWNFQTLPCVEMIPVPIHDCPCIPPLGCGVLRTKYPIPEPMTNRSRHLIQSVTSLEGSLILSEIGWNEIKYKTANKFTACKPDYFIRNGYLYILSLTHQTRQLRVITITALFEDSLVAEEFPNYCREVENERDHCISPLDRKFVVDPEFIDPIILEASKELVDWFNQQREDITNDSKDSLIEESK